MKDSEGLKNVSHDKLSESFLSKNSYDENY